MMKFAIILAACLLAGCASVQGDSDAADAEAFAAFKGFIAQCREAGGCTVVATPVFIRDRMASYFRGVADGKDSCGKGGL